MASAHRRGYQRF
jgi:hypothetical protein